MEEIAGETRGGTARDAPRVTVVIPTRDRWSLLPGALESALSQRGVAVDVVVADDGSTTAPPAEVRRSGVEVVRLETSGGIAAARNAAIVRATGEWVAFLDDDDIWAPDKLRRDENVTRLVRSAYDRGTIVGLICHAGLVGISAEIVKGARATGSLGIKDDLANAGATWVDEPAFRDGNIVWGRVVEDIPDFCRALVDAIEGAGAPAS